MSATGAPRTRVLADWLAWLETLSPVEIDLGLERVADVLGRLDLPRPRRVVNVAGTNGKGSTVAMLEGLYRQRGERVACYTSPHVVRYNERLRVAGRELDDAAIVDAFERVEAARRGTRLTYFEYGTLAALVAFAEACADTWVLEIGLGGRLDAVNAVDPDGALVTNVSLDHCEWLGPDVESIAREKAAVMRAGRPAVFGATPAPAALVEHADAIGADLRLAGRDYRYSADGDTWRFAGRDVELDGLARPSLAGDFQLANAAATLALFEALEGADALDGAAVDAAFAALCLPGRLQAFEADGRQWLLDVAHNPAAAAVLAAELGRRPREGRLIAVLGILKDKDAEGLVGPLLPIVDRFIATTPESSRALDAVELARRVSELSGKPCRIAPGVPAALAAAARLAGPGDTILVSGSFYTVGPALQRLGVPAPAARYTRGARAPELP